MATITHATGRKGSRATKTSFEVTEVRLGKSGKKAIVTVSNGDRFFFPLSILPDLTSAAVEHLSDDDSDGE